MQNCQLKNHFKMEEEHRCFASECRSDEISSQKNLHSSLVDAADTESWIVDVGGPQLANSIPENCARACEEHFSLSTDHMNSLHSLNHLESAEKANEENEKDEEESSNKLSQQLSTLSVSKIGIADNGQDECDVTAFADILGSQESKQLNEILNFSSQTSQNKNREEIFENICRICGNEAAETISIFPETNNEEESGELSLFEKLTFYLPIKIDERDNLPKVICHKCNELLNQSHELAAMSLLTESNFRRTISDEKIDVDNIFNEVDGNSGCENSDSQDREKSQNTSTGGGTFERSVSSVLTDDEDDKPFTTFEGLKNIKEGERKRQLSRCSIDDSRPFKVRRAEPSFERRFECNLCMATYSDEEGMNFHKNRHRLKKPILFWCNFCHSEFIKKSRFMKHMRRFHKRLYQTLSECSKCKKCNQVFSLRAFALAHFIKECGVGSTDDPVSDKCIENFHIKYAYTCEYCYKSFGNIPSLHEHRHGTHFTENSSKNHEKPPATDEERRTEAFNSFGIKNSFVCKFCTRVFIHFNSFIYHQQEHADTQFNCSMCDEKFSTWSDAREHRENEHSYQIIYHEKLGRLCVCFCGMEFDEEEKFMIHEKTHFAGITLYEICIEDKTMTHPWDSTFPFQTPLGSFFGNFGYEDNVSTFY